MQLDHFAATGAPFEAVDVLGNDLCDATERFESRQRVMRRVRPCALKARPADTGARPIALAGFVASDEITKFHRLAMLPLAPLVAVIGNTGSGAQTSAGEYEQALVTADKIGKAREHEPQFTSRGPCAKPHAAKARD